MMRRDNFEVIQQVVTRVANEPPYAELPGLSSINLTTDGVLGFVDNTSAHIAGLFTQPSWKTDFCVICVVLLVLSGYKLWRARCRRTGTKSHGA